MMFDVLYTPVAPSFRAAARTLDMTASLLVLLLSSSAKTVCGWYVSDNFDGAAGYLVCEVVVQFDIPVVAAISACCCRYSSWGYG